MFRRYLVKLINKVRYIYISRNSSCTNVMGYPKDVQPVLLLGKGKIIFEKNVQIGYNPSPLLYSTYAHIEARWDTAEITFGDRVFINNNFSVIAERSCIKIGDNVLIGCNVQIFDSDFHSVNRQRKDAGTHQCKSVLIKDNVFIGNNVTILKGVTIGKNSVISAGSVVYDSFPDNVIIGGNPAVIRKQIINDAN